VHARSKSCSRSRGKSYSSRSRGRKMARQILSVARNLKSQPPSLPWGLARLVRKVAMAGCLAGPTGDALRSYLYK
jgi:hypothetical protein